MDAAMDTWRRKSTPGYSFHHLELLDCLSDAKPSRMLAMQ